MKITLKQLQVYVLTSQYSSITEAAEHCHITQSAASMSLLELEKMLGYPLFDRIGKRLRLNAQGEWLLPQAKNILDQVQEIESLSISSKILTGNLFIGATQTIGNYVLPKKLAQFKKNYPDLNISIIISNTDKVVEKLNTLELDFALIEGESDSLELIKKFWLPDELVIICRRKHLVTKNTEITLNQLKNYVWVMREQSSGTQQYLSKALTKKLQPKIEMVFTEFEAIKSYIANSDCIGCVSKASLTASDLTSLTVLNVKDFSLKREFSLIKNPKKYQSYSSKVFEKFLLTV